MTLKEEHVGSAKGYSQVRNIVAAAETYAPKVALPRNRNIKEGERMRTRRQSNKLRVDVCVHYVLVSPEEPMVERKWTMPEG